MGSKQIVDLAERHGLIRHDAIARFFRKPRKRDIVRLDEDFREALGQLTDAGDLLSKSTYNYLASSSFRGELGCSTPTCRARGIAELARFSLLYADKIVLPLYLPERDPYWLDGNFRILAELRPLLDIGIVVPTESAPCLCKECAEPFAPIFEQVKRAADDAAAHIRVKYLRSDEDDAAPAGRNWTFHFTWPPEYDPAPAPILSVQLLSPSLARFVGNPANERKELPLELLRESNLLMSFFDEASQDYMLHSFLNETVGCVYLSDSDREVQQFRKLSGGKAEETRNAIFASMSHSVPLFADIRLETLVKVRMEDGGAFGA